jgi:hypothetical protein
VRHLGNVEQSSTAASAHDTGDFLVYDGSLYEVTADISVGDEIVAGTNVKLADDAPSSVDDNAMMEWGQGSQIWYKVVPDLDDPSSMSAYIANRQIDSDYHAWSFIGGDGSLKEHFYTPIYNGTIVDGKLRSISGLIWEDYGCQRKKAAQERALAQANGTGWDTETYCDAILVNLLLVLLGKSLNTQVTFGQGLTSSGSETVNNGFTTGVHDTDGMFFGTNSGTASSSTYGNAVKVFGMENWWGFQWRRIAGLVSIDLTMKYKLTKGTQDGSSASDYVVSTTASDYSGYLDAGSLADESGYVKKLKWLGDGANAQTEVGGSSATYYCDYYYQSTGVMYARRGGLSNVGATCGAFCVNLNYAASRAYWDIGCSPSYKPQS